MLGEEKVVNRRPSSSPRSEADYRTLQHIHSNLTTLGRNRPYTEYTDTEAIYARVQRGRGRTGLGSSSEGESDDMQVSAETPLVTSYSTESDDMGVSMETSLARDSSREDASLASAVICDRESRV